MVNQTFSKLDMVYSDCLWSPPDMVSVLILDSLKYGNHQINLYHCQKGLNTKTTSREVIAQVVLVSMNMAINLFAPRAGYFAHMDLKQK